MANGAPLMNYGSMLNAGQPDYFSMVPSPSNYWSATPANGQNYMSMAAYNADPTGYINNLNAGNFDFSQTMQNVSQGLGAFTSLAQIYGMFQNLGLQKKAFRFAQEGTKRNFNAQATAFNEAQASKETARQAYAAANGQDYNSLYGYGTGKKVEKWT